MQISKALGPSVPRPDEACNPRVEPIVKLLALLMLVFSAIIIFCEHFFPMDGQIFQVFSGLLAGISGAFLMRIKPRGTEPNGDPVTMRTTATDRSGTVVQETQVGKGPATATPPAPTLGG